MIKSGTKCKAVPVSTARARALSKVLSDLAVHSTQCYKILPVVQVSIIEMQCILFFDYKLHGPWNMRYLRDLDLYSKFYNLQSLT